MDHYVGLDVSLRETAVCVIDGEGNRIWQGRCASTPDDIEEAIRKHAPSAVRIALETGSLCVWHSHALREVSSR
jgi:transposase